jgi:hypothetical protein
MHVMLPFPFLQKNGYNNVYDLVLVPGFNTYTKGLIV